MKNANRFPKGWGEDRVRRLLDHYESQTEDEAVAGDEAVWEDKNQTLVENPKKILKCPKATQKSHLVLRTGLPDQYGKPLSHN